MVKGFLPERHSKAKARVPAESFIVSEEKNTIRFPRQDGSGDFPESLTNKISHGVPKKIRQRGQDYFEAGRVVILECSRTEVEAVVTGSEEYEVDLRREGDALITLCTCPYFADHGPCKHIWAVILGVDDGESLMGHSRNPPSVLLEDEEWLYDTLDDHEEGGALPAIGEPRVQYQKSAAVDNRSARPMGHDLKDTESGRAG